MPVCWLLCVNSIPCQVSYKRGRDSQSQVPLARLVRRQLSGIGSLLSLRGYQEPNSSPQARLQALLLPALDLPSLCMAFPTRILLQDFHHPEPCLLTYKPWSPDTDPSCSLNPKSEATQVLHGSNQCDQCLPQDLHTRVKEKVTYRDTGTY